jgi:hypothetical protein
LVVIDGLIIWSSDRQKRLGPSGIGIKKGERPKRND